jgi:hypothetical protein
MPNGCAAHRLNTTNKSTSNVGPPSLRAPHLRSRCRVGFLFAQHRSISVYANTDVFAAPIRDVDQGTFVVSVPGPFHDGDAHGAPFRSECQAGRKQHSDQNEDEPVG